MDRRRFIALLPAAITAARTLRAEQKAIPVIGLLDIFSPPSNLGNQVEGPFLQFLQGLSETGFVEGQNVALEGRWAELHYDRLPSLAADLVSRKVDVIVTFSGTPPAQAAKSATSTIPIVFSFVGDPVGIGLVASLARPGGNLTGFSNMSTELMPKLLERICELVPQAGVIALLVNPNNANVEGLIRSTQQAARVKGVQLPVLKARTEGEIDAALASLGQLQAGGLVVDPDSLFVAQRDQVVALATRHAVPAIYAHPEFVTAGGLISYGIDDAAVFRQAGIYAGRILKGVKPADLPVQQPTTFKLVLNLKTAEALGLTVPPSILARVDEVIE
jgi:putative tryptophan/tyrosine transport system substrate-binding protein